MEFGDDIMLVHDDAMHCGFGITQEQHQLVLNQVIDVRFNMNASDELFSDYKKRVAVGRGSVEEMSEFIDKYLNRYSTDVTFTIPFSLNSAALFDGPVIDNWQETKQTITDLIDSGALSEREKQNARKWLESVVRCIDEAEKIEEY